MEAAFEHFPPKYVTLWMVHPRGAPPCDTNRTFVNISGHILEVRRFFPEECDLTLCQWYREHSHEVWKREGSAQSDLFRLMILATQGGIYLDADLIVLNSSIAYLEDSLGAQLDEHDEYGFMLRYSPNFVNNDFFSLSRHSTFHEIAALDFIQHFSPDMVRNYAGPALTTRVTLRERARGCTNMRWKLLQEDILSPHCGTVSKNTLAVHLSVLKREAPPGLKETGNVTKLQDVSRCRELFDIIATSCPRTVDSLLHGGAAGSYPENNRIELR